MESVPPYVSTVFILTTFAAVAFLLQAAKRVGLGKLPSQILIFLLPLWIFFQAVISMGGFYQNATTNPPRLVLFGVLPALLTIVTYLIFFRESFIDKIPLQLLTMLHIIRIPVEIVLLWLFQNGLVPQFMTFEGRNFDILSGILAPIVYLTAFRGGKTKRGLLIAFNVLGLVLLANIVSIAVLSLPSPFQQLAFEQPNRAVVLFPYSWLPTIVVPIVLFSHIAALWKLLRSKTA
ncbi:MAG TPA: hypothetical protein PLL77_04900 [Pyrinomonadaceae bacterium]|nr:hypothetical protein [Pyrinomonadaceae bacterium]